VPSTKKKYHPRSATRSLNEGQVIIKIGSDTSLTQSTSHSRQGKSVILEFSTLANRKINTSRKMTIVGALKWGRPL